MYAETCGCMYAETLGCVYADFGCMSVKRLGAKYADVGCIYMETFGCMYADVGCKVCGCWVHVYGKRLGACMRKLGASFIRLKDCLTVGSLFHNG